MTMSIYRNRQSRYGTLTMFKQYSFDHIVLYYSKLYWEAGEPNESAEAK